MAAPFWSHATGEETDEVFDLARLPWGKVILAGIALPGYSTATANPKRAIDRKKPAGRNGGRLTFHGLEVGTPVEIKVYLWTPEQWSRWQSQVMPIVWPIGKKGGPDALDIQYPALEPYGIRSVAIESITTPQDGRSFDERLITIRALEWTKPANVNATKTPTGSKKRVGVRPEFQAPNFSTPDGKEVVVPQPANAAVRPSSKTPGPNT